MTTITIGKLDLIVAPTVGEETIYWLADLNHWSVGRFEFSDKWKVRPLKDFTRLPAQALERIEVVMSMGIEVEWMIAHEVVVPKVEEFPAISEPIPCEPKPWHEPEGFGDASPILGILGAVLMVPLLILQIFALGFAQGGAEILCFPGICIKDPALLAVVTNAKGERVCVDLYRFYEDS